MKSLQVLEAEENQLQPDSNQPHHPHQSTHEVDLRDMDGDEAVEITPNAEQK